MLGRKDAYLNCAYMSPMMKKVERAGRLGISKKRKPHKIDPSDFFDDTEKIRAVFAALVNCPEAQKMVLIPSVSYGIANVTNNLKISKSQNIVVAGDQFPSNIYPWMRLCQDAGAELRIIAPPESVENRGNKWNDAIKSAIDSSTVAVALGHVHWADGTLFDLEEIRRLTLGVGSKLIIDGTQSVGALPFDIQKYNPDALICAAYKWLMGPYSIGIAYYGPNFDNGKPIEENWINRNKSEDFANLVEYQDDYRAGMLRYEVGEHSNFILTPMFLESLKQIKKWGPENIQSYCHNLMAACLGEIQEMGLFVETTEQRSAHLFGIKCPHEKLEPLKKAFKTQRVSVSFRGDFIRVSPNVYNDERDVRRFISAFRQVFN